MNHFTWLQYLETLAVLLIMYYAVILFKFYLPEVQNKLQGRRPAPAAAMSILQYEEPVINQEAEDPLVQQTEQLIGSLKKVIATHAGRPVAAVAIRQIFQEYPMIKETQLRAAINELVVTECEKNGAALLTEAEVDQWWDAPAGGAGV